MRRWTSVLVHVRSSASLAGWATVFLLTAMVGCDSTPPPAPTPTLESIKDCGAGWQPFTTAQPWDGYSPLVYQAGTLYYTSVNAKALLALPTNGGPPATLAPLVTNELWLEGDHLLLSQGNPANQIYSVPLSGGTPQLVLDGGAGRTSPGPVLAHAFAATDFYWTEISATSDAIPPTVWHQSRASGTANQIGTITFQTPPNQTTAIQGYLTAPYLALTANAILVANAFELAVALPLSGGALASLALPSVSPELASEAQLSGLDIQARTGRSRAWGTTRGRWFFRPPTAAPFGCSGPRSRFLQAPGRYRPTALAARSWSATRFSTTRSTT